MIKIWNKQIELLPIWMNNYCRDKKIKYYNRINNKKAIIITSQILIKNKHLNNNKIYN